MDDGSRVPEDVELFLRAARSHDSVKCASMLDANPALLNSVEAGGFSALHFAAFNGDMTLFDVLLPRHPDLDLKNFDGNTPLVMAVKGKQHESIRKLVEAGADINRKLNGGATALHHAAAMGYWETMNYLFDLGASASIDPCEAGTVLHWACHSGDIRTVGTLLYTRNIPIDVTDIHAGTPLFTALFTKKSELVQFLLEHGANPNAMTVPDSTSPLHIAVEHGTLDDVRNLISFGASPIARNGEGATPLSIAETRDRRESLKELTRVVPTKEKRIEDACRFKAQGNKVFGNGESVKAAKFYTLAISLDPTNHVYFSNRSACYFNVGRFVDALYDAERCLRLCPTFTRGFFRKAATQRALGMMDEALRTIEYGLRLDPKCSDLLVLKEDLTTNSHKRK